MSSSQSTPRSPQESDHPMLDGPDSPPEMSYLLFPNPVGSQSAANTRPSGEPKISHGTPGSTWSTKKFNEEYERVATTLLDSTWDHTRYGDPLMK